MVRHERQRGKMGKAAEAGESFRFVDAGQRRPSPPQPVHDTPVIGETL